MVKHYVYDSFGNIVSQSGTVISRFLFTGREWDEEVGLYHYRARPYSSLLGRFIQEDLIDFEAEDSNLYRYVSNSPIDTKDPLGLYGIVIFQTRSISYEDNGIKQTNNIQTVIDAYQTNPDVEITSDTTYAYIWYFKNNTGSRVPRNVVPPGMRLFGDDRGHIVGAQLGGDGKDKNNVFAQNSALNQVPWRLYETGVRSYLDANGSDPNCPLDLHYTLNLIYETSPFAHRLRPSSYGAIARFSNGVVIPGSLPNP